MLAEAQCIEFCMRRTRSRYWISSINLSLPTCRQLANLIFRNTCTRFKEWKHCQDLKISNMWSFNLVRSLWFKTKLIDRLHVSIKVTVKSLVIQDQVQQPQIVIMGAMASQITSLTIVYSTVYPGADQSKHQSSAPLAFVWGIHRGPVNFPHRWPVTRKMFPFDDVIMNTVAVDGPVPCVARY